MGDKKNSDARIRANNRYNDKAYDRINIAIPKGQKETIRTYASARGDTVNGLLNRLIIEELEGRTIASPTPLLPRDSLQAAETAAAAVGEDLTAFLERAITTQATLDRERLVESR